MSKADLHVKLAGGQKIVGGYSLNVYQHGNSNTLPGGVLALNPLLGNYQFVQNIQAFTITAPTVDCAIDLLIGNNVGAGAVSFSGFTVGFTGDGLTTVSGAFFIVSFRRMIGVSTYTVKALQ